MNVTDPPVMDLYTVDEAIGVTVNQALFVLRRTRKSLGDYLGITGPAAGRKLRGLTAWSVQDLVDTAAFLGVEPADLLPHRVADGATGFKPASFNRAQRTEG